MVFALVAFGYLWGSIPWGVLIGRWRQGIDLRQHGSGNIGVTNALRVLGWKGSALVFAGDALKAVVPILVARWLVGTDVAQVVVALAAIAGHDFSVFLRFKGGRGVTTSVTALATFFPEVAALAVALFLVVVLVTRYVSLGSMLGSGLALGLVIAYYVWGWAPAPYAWFVAVGVPLIWFQHRANIGRLVQGRENRIGGRLKAAPE